jgi:hypothetical protein
MNDTEIAPAVLEREKKEQSALARVKAWEVRTPEDHSELDAFLVRLMDLKKMIVADFAESKAKTKDVKQKATEAHKAVCDQEEGHIGVIEEARRIGKQKLFEFEESQRRETARLQAIADAAAKKKAEDLALEQAAAAEKSGDKETAEAILAEPAPPTPRVEAPVLKRSTVVSVRWIATIGGTRQDGTETDPLFVLRAIEVAGKILAKSKGAEAQAALELIRQAYTDAKYMVYDQVALGRQATATKDALKLGGVAFTSRKV